MFIWQIEINYEKQARSARHQQLLDGASPGDDVGDVLSLDRNSMHCILSSNKGRSSNGATNMGNRAKRLTRWFLVSGCLGVLVALILMTMAASQLVRPTVLLALWPSSIAGIADPSTLSDKIIVAMFEFGGKFHFVRRDRDTDRTFFSQEFNLTYIYDASAGYFLATPAGSGRKTTSVACKRSFFVLQKWIRFSAAVVPLNDSSLHSSSS